MNYITRYTLMAAVALALVAALVAPPPASAQALYGSITGTVTDQQGAAIPGATVTATNTGTGLKLEAVTDEEGGYTFRNLLPGTYDLGASLQGFKELMQTGLRVSPGNTVRVELKLEVGALTETVNVVSETALLQTDKADVNTELSRKAIVNLPLNQCRNYQALIEPGARRDARAVPERRDRHAPAARSAPTSTACSGTATRPASTARPASTSGCRTTRATCPAETIDNVNISTNNFDADQGMAGGAAMTVVTKSGTNELHGSAF